MPGRILVLDDEENYAEMLQGLLRQNHFLVDMATKPELALEALDERNYSLVISDYKMPIMDGAVFLKKAREIFPDLPVILVSGLMNTPELVKVANMGVTLVLEKPLDTSNFLEQVGRFVEPMTDAEAEAAEKGDFKESRFGGPARAAKKVFNFPKILKFLSAENTDSKRYIQETWDNFQYSPNLFFTGPAGSEYELILRELTHWRNQDGKKNHYFSASQLRKESIQSTLDRLDEDPDYSTVVAVGDLNGLSIDEQAFLLEFLRRAPAEQPGEGSVTFTYWLETLKDLNMDLQIEIRKTLVKIPPLRNRPGEIAVYAKRYLEEFSREQERPEPPVLSGSAKNLLLQYPWKGNFAQLIKALKRSVKVMTNEPLPYEALRAILSPMDPSVHLPLEGGDLEEVLITRQQEIIRGAAGENEQDPKEVLSKLGFDVSSMPSEMGIEHLDLLYPELLEVQDN